MAKKRKYGKKQGTKFFVSSCNEAMHTANTSSDFFNAYNASSPCRLAFADNQVSTQGYNLDRYLKLHHRRALAEIKASQPVAGALPEHLQRLVDLQELSGQFCKLSPVLTALDLNVDLKSVRNYEFYAEWEVATAVVVAVIRQHPEYFDLLYPHYEQANQWIRSDEIVQEIRVLIEDAFNQQGSTSASPMVAVHRTHAITQRLDCNDALNATVFQPVQTEDIDRCRSDAGRSTDDEERGEVHTSECMSWLTCYQMPRH
jgi:hypothetical protein